MNAVTEMMPLPLVFTEAAAAKVKQLIDEEGNTNLKLRVFVQGGGCSGFQYAFTFDDQKTADDRVIQQDGAVVLIDDVSWEYLRGSCVDYVEELGDGKARRDHRWGRHRS